MSFYKTSSIGLLMPEYIWDSEISFYKKKALSYKNGEMINLSIGTPIDPTPKIIRNSLEKYSNAPQYPFTSGTNQLKDSIINWFDKRRGVTGLNRENVIPSIGSKELIAWLPTLLGLNSKDIVVYPKLSYPTYKVGAQLVGAQLISSDHLFKLNKQELSKVKLIWINSPSNPTGEVKDIKYLKTIVKLARHIGAIVVSDECYAALGWDKWEEIIDNKTSNLEKESKIKIPSLLDSQVSKNSFSKLLVCYSLSKQSNIAGYRAAFLAGDSKIVKNLLNIRKHLGMMTPYPIQKAMTIALSDSNHVFRQKSIYRKRRVLLLNILNKNIFKVENSEAGLYLWIKSVLDNKLNTSINNSDIYNDQKKIKCWNLLNLFASYGILVTPGIFYGNNGKNYIRISLTVSDAQLISVLKRITLILNRLSS